jgi:hypothetical protein
VCFHVMLGGVFRVLVGMDVVAVGKMGVMGSRFVVSILVMLSGFTVMTRSVFVMLRCLGVMVRCFLGHSEFLSSYRCLCGTMNYRELRIGRSLQWNKFKVNFLFHAPFEPSQIVPMNISSFFVCCRTYPASKNQPQSTFTDVGEYLNV